MGKNRKRKRQKESLYGAPATTAVVATASGGDNGETEKDTSSCLQISEADLATTVAVLQGIGPEQLQDKRFKALRKALHPLIIRQLQSYQNGTDYRIKVTQFLAAQQWSDALAALQGCRDFHQIPKQGTIQRWVRDCDLCTAACKLALLNAILMLSNTRKDVEEEPNGSTTDNANTTTTLNKHDPRLALLEYDQTLRAKKNLSQGDGQIEDGTSMMDASLEILPDWSIGRVMVSDSTDTNWDDLPTVTLQSRILYREAGADRTPPNHYDLLLHTTTGSTLQWSETPPTIIRHDVPFLNDQKGVAFLLENVLTLSECQQLRAAALQLGWRPDHPTSLPQPTGIDSCEWLVDDSVLSVLSQRVQPFLSECGGDTGRPLETTSYHSINPRWRFFRYHPGCVYRPHIDGSWPASRIDPQGNYECYSQDNEGGYTIKSYQTFLIYLNDNFQGGATRFYVPKSHGLVAQGVQPKCGSVLVFSQGNTASLLHEGSAVTLGCKMVVRTDVLYKTKTVD